MSANRRSVIAHHLILTGYGHWLPNDPRGSGSTDVRKEPLRELGEVHHGRKRVQPARSELREFFRSAEPLLEHPAVWFDNAKRQAIGRAFARVVRDERYTCYACAILRNHAHLCIRRHRDSGREMWARLTNAAATDLHHLGDVSDTHPIWSNRPYTVFSYTPDDVRRIITYIDDNIRKHGLESQSYDFVRPYDNWPLHKK